MKKKLLCLFMTLVFLFSFFPGGGAYATPLAKSIEEDAFSCEATAMTVSVGDIVSGSRVLLRFEDRQNLVLSSNASGNCEFLLTYFAGGSISEIIESTLLLTCKATTTVSMSIYIFNGTTYEAIGSFSINNSLANYELAIADLEDYIFDSSIVLKFVCGSSNSFTLSMDSAVINIRKASTVPNKLTQTYSVQSADIETGTTTSNASSLKHRDGNYYAVSSTGNKVAWTTTIQLDQEINSINSLQIDYSGYCSIAASTIWVSLYNYSSNSWQVVNVIDCNTSISNKSVLISNTALITNFLQSNSIRLRLYNSASSSFVRYSDYLSVKVYATSPLTVEKVIPQSITKEYGATMTGTVESIKSFDNSIVQITSNTQNKVALRTAFEIDTPANQIHTLTVNLRTHNSNNTNNLHVSLYNYSTQSFTVFKEVSSQAVQYTWSFTLTDQEQIAKYISSSGEMIVRLYNSASSSFVRYVDYIEVLVEQSPYSSFDIACIADVHSPIGSENLLAAIEDINTNVLPAFTIDLGDMTSHGKQSEYDKYLLDVAELDSTLYCVPGNHENRWWNSNGKNDYYDNLGAPYRSMNYNGIHFVLLDTTVYLANDGKVTKEQLEWLCDDLAAIPTGMPVIVFGHHPFTTNNDITARDELFEVLKNYNILAFVCGHAHSNGKFLDEGIPVLYFSCLKDDATQPYISISFTSREFKIYRHQASNSSKELWYSGTLKGNEKTTFTSAPIVPNSDGDIPISITITNSPQGILSARARIDNYGTYTSLSNTSGNTWTGTIDISSYNPSLPNGKHFVGIEVVDGNSNKWTNYYEYTTGSGTIDILWEYQTGSAIQSSPTYYNGYIYAGSSDGYLYCINASTGVLLWRYQASDSIISKPLIKITSNSVHVVFGSNDKNLYCIDATTGTLVWSRLCGGSVISDPVLANGTIVFGCGDGNIYAVSADTGTITWTYQANGLMRHSPVISNGVIYAVVRNTYIWYALNLSDGSLVWRGNANTDDSYFVCGDISPVVANNKIWCVDAMSGMFSYLNIANGSLSWSLSSSTYGKTNARSMAVNGNVIFFVTNSGKTVHAINSANNSILWTTDLRYNASDSDNQAYMMDCGLVYHNGVLVHVAERGRITILNPTTGAIIDSFDAVGYPERALWSTPEINGNKIFACGIDGKIYCIEFQQ